MPAARHGMTGPVDVFAGKGGFFQHTGSRFELMPLGGLSQPHGHRPS